MYNDFHADSEVAILDGGQCNFGIESTVVKIIEHSSDQFELNILRKGGVSEKALQTEVDTHGFPFSVTVTKKAH